MGEQIDRRMTVLVGSITRGGPMKLRALGSEEFTAYPSLGHKEDGQMMGHHPRVRSPSLIGSMRGDYILPWSGVFYNFLTLIFLL